METDGDQRCVAQSLKRFRPARLASRPHHCFSQSYHPRRLGTASTNPLTVTFVLHCRPLPGAAYTTMQRDALARSYLLDALDTSVEAVNSAIAMLMRATPSAKLYQHIKVGEARQ